MWWCQHTLMGSGRASAQGDGGGNKRCAARGERETTRRKFSLGIFGPFHPFLPSPEERLVEARARQARPVRRLDKPEGPVPLPLEPQGPRQGRRERGGLGPVLPLGRKGKDAGQRGAVTAAARGPPEVDGRVARPEEGREEVRRRRDRRICRGNPPRGGRGDGGGGGSSSGRRRGALAAGAGAGAVAVAGDQREIPAPSRSRAGGEPPAPAPGCVVSA
jgi:hypothetical protein